MDQDPVYKSRNSGLCIATGTGKRQDIIQPVVTLCICTGSTSWIFNINKLTHHAVESLLKITFETTRFPLNWKVTWS